MVITVGLGLVGAAGADEAANADVYAATTATCFSDDAAATACAAGEIADVTINTERDGHLPFRGQTLPHNAVASTIGWKVPATGYVPEERQRSRPPSPQPGVYDVRLLRALRR